MAIAFVRQATGGRSNATTFSVTITAPTAGNALLMAMANNSNTNPTSITGGGVTWVLARQQLDGTNRSGEVWYGLNSSGSGTSVDFTYAAKGHTSVNISEWSGVATSSALDATNGITASSTTIDSQSVTTAIDDEVLIVAANNSNDGIAPSAGPTDSFTALTYVQGNDDNDLLCAYRLPGVVGTYNTTWTVSTSEAHPVSIAAFEGTAPPVNSNVPYTNPNLKALLLMGVGV